MISLSALINEYKKKPNEKLKDELLSMLLQIKNPELLDEQLGFISDDWVIYNNGLRVKRIFGRSFIAAETFYGYGRYLGFCYRIALDDYTQSEIEGYKDNCREYENKSPDDDYFAAASIAMTLDEHAAVKKIASDSEKKINDWYASIEKEEKTVCP